MIKTNYLIIGSGVAGLTFAIKIADRFPNRKITIITKSNEDESNTKYAQGGIAIVTDKTEDSYKKHIDDTLICGDGLCDSSVVEMVVTEGPKRLKELIEWGAKFDKNTKGNFDLGKEGGHSQNRVVHHKDQTGHEIERAILAQVHQKENITVLDHHFALDLITQNNFCFGAYALDEKTKEIITFKSDFTVLATGGIGHLYGHTTNPVIATGDGIAMAFRANASIKDMEFIQFHPTALYDSSAGSKFLISEAVRGFGAYLRTKKGHRFMLDYDSRGELASRDIVSQSIDLELKKSGDDCVYLDCTHLDLDVFIKHFPMIYERCKSIGIDIAKDWIPVIPAQHYLCGGIMVDKNGKTTVANLFACGECSQTGLHGANRLASNSLLEALVYSDKIYNYLANISIGNSQFNGIISNWESVEKPEINSDYLAKMKTELQLLMRQNAGIVRYDSDLPKAKEQLLHWQNEMEEIGKTHQISVAFYELLNMITIGNLIVQQSIERKENRGGFMKVKATGSN
ncbi:L-aspartate oxidase [Flavobacterium gawalongense]|uniref:L-aspartate oxidase n=1 Tax=Flavobacterium gawalongense TaxID=2594432 RepID=A0A553BKC1_9FLAO|nr:L-aspartate oxidase [Flavobacterium gawalongense]TRX08690.1 L-aspartate oxidase [Flavobacterium gawalongense]TRX09473.1 L-aspartate oxidase [Flavobacterium gawalongense]TRX25444.1 L-aspartate oxidase [Flavobacterium gawalongense]